MIAIDRPFYVESEAQTVRNERRWSGRGESGEKQVLSQLLPELAVDESLRRRYVYEAESLAAIDSPYLATTIAIGPNPNPRDPSGISPWRLREDPSGVRLDMWLRDRAPATVEECIALLASLAKSVHSLNQAGLVLRDLEPRSIVLGSQNQVTITDVGLARMDILSSRTASSLMLESSAYAAPEHLRATVVDARADVYTAAAIVWQALTGVLPYDEGSPFLRDYHSLPKLQSMREGVPLGLDRLLRSCLAESPEQRPKNLGQVYDILQGDAEQSEYSLERMRCQACGEELRLGLRLCLHCGKRAVQFSKAAEGKKGYSIFLVKASETPEFHQRLHHFYEDVGEGEVPKLNFLVGDTRMYSKGELEVRTRLPAPLLGDLSLKSGESLAKRLKEEGFKVKLRKGKMLTNKARVGRSMMLSGLFLAGIFAVPAVWAGSVSLLVMGFGMGGILAGIGARYRYFAKEKYKKNLAGLREAPLALPASDPHVARLASLLKLEMNPDVREQVSELALLVQRLCDHRSANVDHRQSIEMLTQPLEKLVDLIREEVQEIVSIDTELRNFDEGHLIRAIAASSEREEERGRREGFMNGLDTLRNLEKLRTSHMGNLLDASALLERTVYLGLSETDQKLLQSNRITMALAELGEA